MNERLQGYSSTDRDGLQFNWRMVVNNQSVPLHRNIFGRTYTLYSPVCPINQLVATWAGDFVHLNVVCRHV